jgi:hypothetical protein
MVGRQVRFGAAGCGVLVAAMMIVFAPPLWSQAPPGLATANAPQYTPDGQLKVPTGFETWVFVGSNLALGYKDELKETTRLEATRASQQQFHNIYINPEAYAYFVATRNFRTRPCW